MDLKELLLKAEQEEGKLLWEGTFDTYLQMAVQNPAIAQLSHARIYNAIMAAGVDYSSLYPRYNLFDDEVFGLERSLDRLAQYFASAAQRFEVRKRILLMLGPPAAGKSTIVNLMKRAMERYTETDEGAMYAIKGCPMQEEPLHLIPHQMRGELEEEYGLYIEGDLCPRCRYMLRHEYDGKISKVPVRRVVVSEGDAVGIGTFIAADSSAQQSVAALTGSIDESLLGGDRLQAGGRAYRLDGELNVANRGLMEFIEIFKTDERLLTLLLSLAQEQVVKTGKSGAIYADEAIIGHSNESDFNAFVADPRTEALQDRIITVKIGYNLRMSDEVRIYDKMLESAGFGGVHLSPLTIPVMGIYSVLSRMEPPNRQGLSLLDKLRLYDERFVPPYSPKDVVEIQESHPREGMEGISPRYVMNRLSAVVTSEQVSCLLPLPALNSLWEGLEEHISLAQETKDKYLNLLSDAVKEYNDMTLTALRKAAVEDFDRRSSELFNTYWAACEAWVEGTQMQDPSTGVMMDPDERAMRKIEELVGISERDKGNFRREIHEGFAYITASNRTFDYTTDPRIRSAIERMLFPDMKELRDKLTPRKGREPEAVRTRGTVTHNLKFRYGFCDVCAEDLIEYVLHINNRGKAFSKQRGNRIKWEWPQTSKAPRRGPSLIEQPAPAAPAPVTPIAATSEPAVTPQEEPEPEQEAPAAEVAPEKPAAPRPRRRRAS